MPEGDRSPAEPVPQSKGEREEQRAPLAFPQRRAEALPSTLYRIQLAPQHRAPLPKKVGKPPPVSVKTYQAALLAIKPHRTIIADHERGIVVDEAALKKARAIVSVYQRTITAYEEQCQRSGQESLQEEGVRST